MENNLLNEFLSYVAVDDFDGSLKQEISENSYFGMPLRSIVDAEKRLKQAENNPIAYFSMEYGLGTSFYNTYVSKRPLDPDNKVRENTVFSNFRLADYFFAVNADTILEMPIYSGGLGVLAGDTLKTMSDYKMPVIGIGILWHAGYFRQRFWFKYGQVPEKMHWNCKNYPGLIPLKNIVSISLKDETIYLKLWKYYVYSHKHDYVIPLLLLDADIEQNSAKARELTEQLYRSDNAWLKILQRVVLGFGGIAALNELGYPITKFHLNEGHAVFAFVEKARGIPFNELGALREKFVYTCHTPVEAGHDRFSSHDLENVLKPEDFNLLQQFGREETGMINLTLVSMNVSSSINAVSKNHQTVMKLQFPRYRERIQFVTNGVHPYSWISPEFYKVFKDFPDVFENIDENPMILQQALTLKDNQEFRSRIWAAHQSNKESLFSLLEKWQLGKNYFTLCWARRIAAYKRPSLLLNDINRLIGIAQRRGPIQIIIAGKAHPNDNLGFTYINEILDKVDSLTNVYDILKIIILENYDMYLGKMLTSGVDVWLNNPLPPFEASGTSGMKAILNGVVQVSTYDGWVVEAADKGIGKIFGYKNPPDKISPDMNLHMQDDAVELYRTLEETVDLYYKTNNKGVIDFSSEWIDMMINCVATGAYFNTYRMLDEYKELIWSSNVKVENPSLAR